jgi:signal-induced proliferation-associated 1 like protein 1
MYYHQGECITLHVRPEGERDELMEVVVRLRAMTSGCPAQELALRRNGVGQLGFHVQPDGVVTQVEPAGLAWQAGLRQGARLVEARVDITLFLFIIIFLLLKSKSIYIVLLCEYDI